VRRFAYFFVLLCKNKNKNIVRKAYAIVLPLCTHTHTHTHKHTHSLSLSLSKLFYILINSQYHLVDLLSMCLAVKLKRTKQNHSTYGTFVLLLGNLLLNERE